MSHICRTYGCVIPFTHGYLAHINGSCRTLQNLNMLPHKVRTHLGNQVQPQSRRKVYTCLVLSREHPLPFCPPPPFLSVPLSHAFWQPSAAQVLPQREGTTLKNKKRGQDVEKREGTTLNEVSAGDVRRDQVDRQKAFRGEFLFTVFPHQEPGGRGPPL